MINKNREIILNNSLNPCFKKEFPDHKLLKKTKMANLNCGDVVDLYIILVNNKIIDCGFNGSQCLIATASANLLSDLIFNQTKENAILILNNCLFLLDNKKTNLSIIKNYYVFEHTLKIPYRINCVKLAIKGYLKLLNE